MRGGLSAEDCARIRAVRWTDRTGRHKDPSVRGFHPSTTRTVRTGRAGITLIVRPRCSTAAEKPQRWTMRASTNVYRSLIKTLLKAGIITERTHNELRKVRRPGRDRCRRRTDGGSRCGGSGHREPEGDQSDQAQDRTPDLRLERNHRISAVSLQGAHSVLDPVDRHPLHRAL